MKQASDSGRHTDLFWIREPLEDGKVKIHACFKNGGPLCRADLAHGWQYLFEAFDNLDVCPACLSVIYDSDPLKCPDEVFDHPEFRYPGGHTYQSPRKSKCLTADGPSEYYPRMSLHRDESDPASYKVEVLSHAFKNHAAWKAIGPPVYKDGYAVYVQVPVSTPTGGIRGGVNPHGGLYTLRYMNPDDPTKELTLAELKAIGRRKQTTYGKGPEHA